MDPDAIARRWHNKLVERPAVQKIIQIQASLVNN